MKRWSGASMVLQPAGVPAEGALPGDSLDARMAAARAERETRKLNTWAKFFLATIVLIWGSAVAVGFQVALSLLTVIGLLAAILGLRKPLVGLLGIGMLCTLDAMSRVLLLTGGLLRWNTLNYWLLVVMALHIGLLIKGRDVQSKFILLFVIVLSFGLLFTPASDMEGGYMSVLNVVIFFGLLVYWSRQAGTAQIWFLQGLVCGTLAAVGSLMYYMAKSHLPYINPNAWAYFPLTAIFSLCLGYHFAPKGWKSQVSFWVLAVTNYAWIFLSGSRGSMLVGSVCMLFLLLTTRSTSQKLIYAFSAVLVGLVVIHQFTDLDAEAVHRVSKLFDPSEKLEQRTSGRSDLALGAWLIFQSHPFGVGTGGFGQAWADLGYRDELSGWRYGKQMQAHSGWAKVLSENGIPGMLFLLGFVFSFVVGGWRKKRDGLFAIGFLVTMVFVLAFTSTDFAGKGLWYFSSGATVLLNMRRKPRVGFSPPAVRRVARPVLAETTGAVS